MWFANEIRPGLFVGNVNDAADNASLRRERITLVVNCSNDLAMFFKAARRGDLRYLKVPVNDNLKHKEIRKMARLLPWVVGQVGRELDAGGRVLVHCYAGRQRSAIVAAGVLVSRDGMGVGEAVERVRARRPGAFEPQANFLQSLVEFSDLSLGNVGSTPPPP